jgi:hypothetical protein
MEVPQKTKNTANKNTAKPFLGIYHTVEVPAHQCLLLHLHNGTSYGISLGAHQWMNGYRKGGIHHGVLFCHKEK